MVIFFALFTLMYAVASSLVAPRRMVDINNVTEFAVEDISNEMQFDSEDSSMTELDVEDISNEMQFDSEDSSMTEVDVEDISYEMQFDSEDSSMTEVDVEDISNEMQFDSEDSSMTEVDVEDISYEMQFDSEDSSMTEVDVEDISNEMQFDSEDNSMTEVDVEDISNITESARRRMTWSNCAVYKGSHSAQYLYIHGKCRHIRSWNTVFNWYGRNVYQKISQSTMNACRKGDDIKVGWLMRGHGTHPVYAVFNGKKHHIANRSTFNRCRFHWSQVVDIPRRVVDGYPTGPSIKV